MTRYSFMSIGVENGVKIWILDNDKNAPLKLSGNIAYFDSVENAKLFLKAYKK